MLLEMRGITKTFPGVKALDDVNLKVEKAEIHALVGENGAGKSTLMNVLSGIYPFGTYSGDIVYDGQVCRFKGIKDSEKLGIVIIHQELALVPYLSIGANMFLGNEKSANGVINWNDTYEQAQKYLNMVGLEEDAHTFIKDIGVGKQQLVEIAKALAKSVRLLILDEPTSALNESDARKLLDMLIDFRDRQGISSIIISHKLNEIAYCADKITIIRDGKTIETLDKSSDSTVMISEDRIIQGMVGREMTNRYPPRTRKPKQTPALRVSHWNVYHPLFTERKLVDDVSLNVRHGEVVGIAGLVGAGRTELAMSVFGKSYGTKITGEIEIDGKPAHLNNISTAINAGLAYVTEDRKTNGLLLSTPILRNISLARMDRVSQRGILDADRERVLAIETSEVLRVKTPTVDQHVGNLSGGNQQKVLFGKWVFAQPNILILDEPTRGVDVGAKYEIYQIIEDLAAQDKAILMISSEMPELLGMCDRIYVMYEGRIIAEIDGAQASQERIMNAIMQASKRGAVAS